jgi:hypothetical protein
VGSWLIQQGKQWLGGRWQKAVRRRSRVHLFAAIQPLLDEILLFLLVIALLFWSARWQGISDARRYAYESTTTLPAIALLSEAEETILGIPLNHSEDPPLNYRLFGDRELVNYVYRREDNDTSIPEKSRVWRLLLEQEGWIYIFTTIPDPPQNTSRSDRPKVVLAIQETVSDQRMILLSPSPLSDQ